MPNSCICCGQVKKKNERVSMFRFPADLQRRQQCLEALSLAESDISDQSRVCSRHFLHGDSSNVPILNLGCRFASPCKKDSERGKRAQKRRHLIQSPTSPSLVTNPKKKCAPQDMSAQASSSRASSVSTYENIAENMGTASDSSILSPQEYGVVTSTPVCLSDSSFRLSSEGPATALAARVEVLEAETQALHSVCNKFSKVPTHFCLEQISHSDELVQFYTGFVSHQVLMHFFDFLGPAVNRLSYWGEKQRKTTRRNKKALDPLNQFFLTLVKLRLNLRVIDLAVRFGVSKSVVSKYFITWVCFLYSHLKEINWTPLVEQVAATLPVAFRDKYPTTFSILDASELFVQKPSDLFLQSSSWSNYKHHNTAKFLIGCTPNGVVSFVSELYVGSISDVELTKVSGYVDTLKSGVSVMADRGFTIRDILLEKGVTLNIPPFMDGGRQFSCEEIQRGRSIASLRIHVERVIGRIKNYSIIKGTLPISMVRLANSIVSVCAWLVNFQPALIPLPGDTSTDEVDRYFQTLEDSDYDADSEASDTEN